MAEHLDSGNGPQDAVAALQAAYGPPSQSGFGSAVFHDVLPPEGDLEQAARTRYQHFVGDLWERVGQEAWLGPWRTVYRRPAGAEHHIVAELRGISDPEAALSVPMILDCIDAAPTAQAALSAVYDDPAMADLQAFNLGDGAAMSGVLVAGRREDQAAVSLVFLLD